MISLTNPRTWSVVCCGKKISMASVVECNSAPVSKQAKASTRNKLGAKTTGPQVQTRVTGKGIKPEPSNRASLSHTSPWSQTFPVVEKYFTRSLRSLVKFFFFQHNKRNFVSPSDHVIFYLLYKHQWNAKPLYLNSFLVWKVRFITWYFIGVYNDNVNYLAFADLNNLFVIQSPLFSRVASNATPTRSHVIYAGIYGI